MVIPTLVVLISKKFFGNKKEDDDGAIGEHPVVRFLFDAMTTGNVDATDEMVDPDFREFILKRRNKVLSTGEPAPYTETRHLRLDGTSFPSEMVVGQVIWGGRAGTMNIIHDITERKRAEEALRASVWNVTAAPKARLSCCATAASGCSFTNSACPKAER